MRRAASSPARSPRYTAATQSRRQASGTSGHEASARTSLGQRNCFCFFLPRSGAATSRAGNIERPEAGLRASSWPRRRGFKRPHVERRLPGERAGAHLVVELLDEELKVGAGDRLDGASAEGGVQMLAEQRRVHRGVGQPRAGALGDPAAAVPLDGLAGGLRSGRRRGSGRDAGVDLDLQGHPLRAGVVGAAQLGGEDDPFALPRGVRRTGAPAAGGVVTEPFDVTRGWTWHR